MKKDYSTYIQFLRALASEERIDIINALQEKEMCVSEVEKSFYMEQSTASHHLNILKKAGLVSSRRNGKQMIYSVEKEAFRKIYNDFMLAMNL